MTPTTPISALKEPKNTTPIGKVKIVNKHNLHKTKRKNFSNVLNVDAKEK